MFRNIFRRESSAPKRPQPAPMEADIKLQNHGIVVHPGDAEPGSEENTVISGHFLLKSDSSINICGTRISFIVLYKYKRLGKETWEEAILHEQSQTFICGDNKRDLIHVEYEEDKDIIRRRINFSIVVPKDIATYEYLPAGGIIQPHMRVSVELNNVDWDPESSTGLHGRWHSRPSKPPSHRKMDWRAGDTRERRVLLLVMSCLWSNLFVTVQCMSAPTITTGSLSPGSTSAHRVQTWEKHLLISANPNPSMGPSALRRHKRGVAAGIGEWNVYLWSDAFTVGGYVVPRIEFSHMATACNIYSIELHLQQTYSIIPYDEFQIGVYDLEEYQYPTKTFELESWGKKPKTNKPGTDAQALWRGTDQPMEEEVKRFTWEADKPVRLPVAESMRPSTCPGTKTPIILSHKFVLKVYFSVTGETVAGEQIPDANGVGHLRLLIVTVPELLPSCTCVNEWVTLPDYNTDAQNYPQPPQFSQSEGTQKKIPICACCYKSEQFLPPPFSKAFPAEEAEQRERLAPLPTQSKSPVAHTAGSL
ncbi:hypothetical protein NCC49_001384 [Naganishia albida]|nr:hypothetical protein NCC49_001384 [Naganishia albida]